MYDINEKLMMRKLTIVLASACVLLCGSISARDVREYTTPASDSRITYVGRTLTEDGRVSFDWSGVYARIRFQGSYLAMTASDTKANWYDVWIDKEPCAVADMTIRISGSDSTYVLASPETLKDSRKDAVHTAVFKKRTEGEQGRTTISGYTTRGYGLLQAEELKARQIEFIGDSYTCGYGAENSVKTDPFKPETENCNLTYASIISRYFDADCFIVAHSGMGIARNYNDKFKEWYMPERYTQTFDGDRDQKWSSEKSPFKPAVTVIYLCTNDFSTGRQPLLKVFNAQYVKLLEQVKKNYGKSHPVLCISSRCDDMAADYVRYAVRNCGLENVHFLSLTDAIHNDSDELGASSHPNYKAHVKIAHAVIPYVSTLTGWELDDNIK